MFDKTNSFDKQQEKYAAQLKEMKQSRRKKHEESDKTRNELIGVI